MDHVYDQDSHPLEHKGFDFEKYYEELGDKVSAKCVNVTVFSCMLSSVISVPACHTSYETSLRISWWFKISTLYWMNCT